MVSPNVSGQHYRLALKLITLYQPHQSLNIAIPMAFGYSLLLYMFGMGVASLTLLAINNSAVAQMPSLPNRMPLGERPISQVNVLFVNPSIGDDTTGNGSDRTPLKTITQALRVAKGNTVIMLAQGNYSEETGETFPLILRPGISIQGDAANKGSGITIQGGGLYLSRSYGGQNVTIVGANQAELTGVSVTNANPRGYGLWIESSNPVVSENTFTGSTQDGVAVSGNGAPTISKNYFYRNGANGITLSGSSQAKVQENIFQETGYGVNITQNAAPVVMGNQIQNNRSGILVQGKARPIVRNNLIADSQEDGLVAIAQAMPDLGNTTEAGGNEFRNNARYDINASTVKEAIAATGNTLTSNKITGKVDLNAPATAVVDNSLPTTPNTTISAIPSNPEITVSTTEVPPPANPVAKLPTTPIKPKSPQLQLTPPPGGFPVPSSLVRTQPATNTQPTPTAKPVLQPASSQFNYVQIDRNTIEFTAPTPIPNTTISPGSAALLPVPDGNVPLGNTSNLRKVPVPQTNINTYTQSYLPPTNNTRYRVIVEVANEQEQELVKFVAPGAFSTIWKGRRVMQAGVFSNRYNADEMLKNLTNNGLRTIIEPLN
ncbi:parallel beta-helix repeat-containing protein [Nostoc piscinale CENA21]|uniref:Parallel beta-helix repeat-containing protein n=1 Tax=Nostoc piscinale CENA21 TaxID=224013 RepID=A0A0M4SW15_9NOSO|nr:DUF1565 domain-containing protein [Nostoc piscinale]ALF56002.1 parallel beta-helix repeat-containing protein [Nostoc piscinale CENA21]